MRVFEWLVISSSFHNSSMSGRSTSFKRKRIPEYQGTGKRFKKGYRSTVSTLSRKVNKILSEQERKNLDSVAVLTPAVGVASIVQLNSIPQGDDAVSRDGRKVSMVSSQIRYTVTPTSTGNPGYFRVMVLRDLQSNGITPVAADILTVPGNIRSPLTMDFKERFRILHDNFCGYGKGFYDLGTTGAAGSHVPTIPCSYFYKFKDADSQVEYGNIGNIPTSNSLILVFFTEGAAATASMSYYHRLRFTDS